MTSVVLSAVPKILFNPLAGNSRGAVFWCISHAGVASAGMELALSTSQEIRDHRLRCVVSWSTGHATARMRT